MAGEYGFRFDSAHCSGCKACQMACKDRNDTPKGVLWRRVYEVAGGSWRKEGEAWVPEVTAYNLSIACNHCENPLCLDGCPAKAISKREDGIILIDPDKCLGCRYCEWACPYGAPQFDAARGIMTKCDLCAGLIDTGDTPSCVRACPMRALEFGEIEKLRAEGGTADVHPLPDASITKPSLVIRPHRQAGEAAPARVDNREEV